MRAIKGLVLKSLLLATTAVGAAGPAWALPPLAKQPPQAGAVGPDQAPQAVDPAADPNFNAELPPLDQVQAPPPATPAEAQPAPDPALQQPLAPLAGFDPNPDIGKASVPAGEASRIRYVTKVIGLDKVGLQSQFEQYSSLEKGKKKAANAAQVSARAAEDVALAERLLKSQGYYDGVASSAVAQQPGEPAAEGKEAKPGPIEVTITATPGMRYDFAGISIAGAAPEPTRIARTALPLKTGDPIVTSNVLAGEANVALELPRQGYPFAKTGQRDVLLDGATHTGDYTLPLDAGPRSVFGGIETKGDPVFGIDHLGVFPRYKPGQLYDQRWTEDMRQALVATSLFSSVAVEPVDTGRKDPAGNSIVDLLVTQNKGPWRTLSGSGGYGTGEGVKVEGTWTHRNRFPPEGALQFGAIAGTLQQGVNASFIRSNAGQRDRTFSLSAAVDRQNFDAYEARTITLGINWSRVSTPIWQKRWTWSIGAQLVGTNEQGAALNATDDRPRRNYLIAALPGQIGYDTSDDLLNPTRGVRVTARLSPEAAVRSGVRPYVRSQVQVVGYYPVTDSIVLAGRALTGSILGISLDNLAPSRRFYSGGGGSVRGYGFQQLGPKDPQDNPIGGRTVTEFAAEARYRFGNFGIVPFIDAGRIDDSSTPGLSGLRYGAGIGGRYYTNFGPMRLDIATPLNRQRGDSRITVYISIGQAF